MKIAVLTSSRADYGIYLPLLNILKIDHFFDLEIIAFGTHLSKFHGFTIDEIILGNYKAIKTISTFIVSDDEQSIATTYGLTVLKFADFWAANKYDLVLSLGDRFEMNAAVQAGIPFGVKFAHFHGGEITLGAIDNIYRHQITLASKIHFTATEAYKLKVIDLIGADKDIYVTGALSLNNINTFDVLSKDDFFKMYNIPDKEYALVTFQSETVNPHANIEFAKIIKEALTIVLKNINLIITMSNADTFGTEIRRVKDDLKIEFPENIVLVENFGKTNYFTAMKYCKFLLGNTSSGIIEAASFGKFVVNIGNRQKGRAMSDNILQASYTVEDIVSKAYQANIMGKYTGVNIYFKPNTVTNIVSILKKKSNEEL